MLEALLETRKESNQEERGQVPLAHAYNPSYSGGIDQEDHSLKPRQIVHETLSQKNPSQKKGWRSGSMCRP
jgi:hypothetical protein